MLTNDGVASEFDWFDLVWFYGISTIVFYLILNHIYTYILNIYVVDKFFKRA